MVQITRSRRCGRKQCLSTRSQTRYAVWDEFPPARLQPGARRPARAGDPARHRPQHEHQRGRCRHRRAAVDRHHRLRLDRSPAVLRPVGVLDHRPPARRPRPARRAPPVLRPPRAAHLPAVLRVLDRALPVAAAALARARGRFLDADLVLALPLELVGPGAGLGRREEPLLVARGRGAVLSVVARARQEAAGANVRDRVHRDRGGLARRPHGVLLRRRRSRVDVLGDRVPARRPRDRRARRGRGARPARLALPQGPPARRCNRGPRRRDRGGPRARPVAVQPRDPDRRLHAARDRVRRDRRRGLRRRAGPRVALARVARVAYDRPVQLRHVRDPRPAPRRDPSLRGDLAARARRGRADRDGRAVDARGRRDQLRARTRQLRGDRRAGAPPETAVGRMTVGDWIGPDDRPLCGWWSEPARGSVHGVVVLPPLGYEYLSAHRTLRSLAEAFAAAGFFVFWFDYDGTGDSAGGPTGPGRLAAWGASVLAAVAELRARGCEHVPLAGLRFGGTLALVLGAQAKADRVIARLPVLFGKRFVCVFLLLVFVVFV